MQKDFKDLAELLFYQAGNFSNKNALNFKENGAWRSFSNREFLDLVVKFACGLRELGFKKGDRLAIYAYQSPIWLVVDFAVILLGGVSVPIFHNVARDNLLFQIKHAKCRFVFADFDADFEEKNHFNKVSCLESELPEVVEKVISYGFAPKNSINFEVVVDLGERISSRLDGFEELRAEVEVDDLATIIYTSGSTGDPKGVCLSHDNLVMQIKAAEARFPFDEGQKVVSFLPLAHIFERMVMMLYLARGVSVYFVDDVKNLGAVLQEVKPSAMTVVPRVLEKVFAKISDGVARGGFLSRFLGKMALRHALREGGGNFLDCLVYKKFLAGLGGNLEMVICGGAALSNEMERFFCNIGVRVLCGYGLTETSPVLAVNYEGGYRFGTVGKAFDGVELKLDEDGELLAKGRGVMLGYYEDEERTKEVMEGEWFRTGDLAAIEDGFVRIIGRKKELFKTANGKYVRPVPIEQELVQKLGFLIGAVILAEGRSFVSALLFPDFELLKALKKKLGFEGEGFLASKVLNDYVQGVVDEVNAGLDRGEQIFEFKIIEEEISIESGHITPSMKLKRAKLEEDFA